MAISEATEYFEGLGLSIKKAKKDGIPTLYSHVKKINHDNPLSFYIAGQKEYAGERFFWQNPAQDISIVGLGNVKIMREKTNSNRFQEVEEQWLDLVRHSIKKGITGVSATGPLIFGGFAFDEKKENGSLWEEFGDYLFYIPTFMFSIVHGQTYMTTNILCDLASENSFYEDIKKKHEELLYRREDKGMFSINQVIEQAEVDTDEWLQAVSQAVEEMKKTNLKKVVLARELRTRCEEIISSEAIIEKLLEEQRGSYIFSLEVNDNCFIGATPEKLIKKTGNKVFSDCMAGSIGRGHNKIEDEELSHELWNDPKNRLEHDYVVSMITNAFEETCEKVKVPGAPEVIKNRHIQHLYTPVYGECSDNVSVLRLVDRLHPTPAMGGLPKEEAVTRIREMEHLDRGLYAGPLGWIDAHGNSEFAVGIRSALLKGKEASLFAGCGILDDSLPEKEYQETAIKFNPMLSALGGKLYEG